MPAPNSTSPAHVVGGRSRRTGRRIALAVMAAAAIGLLVASGLLGCSSPSGNAVNIHDLQFDPKVITVPKGTTVTWTNNDQTAHTVVSDSIDSSTAPAAQKFKSDFLNPGQSYSHRFDEVGRYPYHCDIHPYLKGEVVVQ